MYFGVRLGKIITRDQQEKHTGPTIKNARDEKDS